MKPATILFSVLVTCSSIVCYAQTDTITPTDTLQRQRRISNFDFERNRIFLCFGGRHQHPTDPRCFTNDIDCIGDVSYLRITSISHRHNKDTSYLTFDYDSELDGLLFRSNNKEASFVLDQRLGVIKHIVVDSLNPNIADTTYYSIFRNEKRDANRPLIDEEVRRDAATNISYETWPNGQLKSKHVIFSYPGETYVEIEEYDSLGYQTMTVNMLSDSILWSHYDEFVPGTGYVAETGKIVSLAPLVKETFYTYEYEFDRRGNWTKKVQYDGTKKVHSAERRFKYLSERPPHYPFGQAYEPWHIANAYFSIFEFEGYKVVINGKKEEIYARTKERKKLWQLKTRKLDLGEYFDKVMYVDRVQIGKYDLKITLRNGQVILIRSKNGKVKRRA